MQCAECKNDMNDKKDKNLRFCSNICKNRAISRLKRGDHRRVYMICRNCGERYIVKMSQKNKTKYCSRKCQGVILGKGNKKC
jgi:endogenous inhibitor of DNA gyrase (YacG/DUF329 family)